MADNTLAQWAIFEFTDRVSGVETAQRGFAFLNEGCLHLADAGLTPGFLCFAEGDRHHHQVAERYHFIQRDLTHDDARRQVAEFYEITGG